jgi:KUP system potassium uptake protein
LSDVSAGSQTRRPGKPHGSTQALLPLTLTAIGVVYGDIGTSPLYTIRECFYGTHSVPVTPENVLGVLSLIIYALLIVISVKYIAIVMRADNRGEGGILALAALVPAARNGNGINGRKARHILMALGIFGAALLYGDGMITPAITVLGAVEGLTVATPMVDPYVVPIAVVILVGIFAIQQRGTHQVGRLFGPVMVLWFITIALLGVQWIVKAPQVLWAIDPRHAFTFFHTHGLHGFAVLGAVFLAVTGGEALYADMGHFGKRPIRFAWFALVLPALLINYFGQGALLLTDGAAAEQPFFLMAPAWGLLPLVALATAAAIIASQALISGAFSLTQQAVQLGYSPRLDIDHTSSQHMGQIYVPQVNWFLMIGTIAIVLGFRSSSALAAAYGIAVTLTMVITTLLLHAVATERWNWPVGVTALVTGTFLAIDLGFFGANLLKVFHGGWLPLVIGGVLFALMTTWKTGRQLLAERLTQRAVPLEQFVAAALARNPTRVPGTAVFMTAQAHGTPAALVHNLRHNKVLHERVIVLTVQTTRTPHVAPEDRLTVVPMGKDLFNASLRYGFMDEPNVPEALRLAAEKGLPTGDDVTYFLGRETVIVTKTPGMALWRERLFVLMAKNAVRATAFFKLPPDNVVELGVQVEI